VIIHCIHAWESNQKKKHSIEFETRFEIETRIIIIEVPLIHPMQKLSGNTQNHQCHTHKAGRQAGRCYRIDNMVVKREIISVKYCNYYHECNIKENESWVGGQLWNHISKQIINGHFIFPIILYSNKSKKANIIRYDRTKKFPQKLFFCKSFPSLTFQSQSIMVVSLHLYHGDTHTHTHLWLKHESLRHINQVKFKIFFTQLMLNSRYR
jgi:hypothetical protein